MAGISAAARIISVCPTVTEYIQDNSKFVVLSPNAGSFTLENKPVTKASESRKEYGTSGPASVTGYNTTGDLGTFKFQPYLDGESGDDYFLRGAIAGGDWEGISASSHKRSLVGATYTEASGVLDLTGLSGDQPENLSTGWCVRIYNTVTKIAFHCEVTETGDGTNVWALEPPPDDSLPASLSSDWEISSERVREKLEMMMIHVKDHQTDNGIARYYPGCVINKMDIDLAVQDDVKITYGLTGGQAMIIKENNDTFPGETYIYPESHPTVTTAVDTGHISVNGVDQTEICSVVSAKVSITRGIKENGRVFVLGGICGVSLKNIDAKTDMALVYEDASMIKASINNTKIGVAIFIPLSDEISYAVSIPSNTVEAAVSEEDDEMVVNCSFSAERNDDLGLQTAIYRFRP